MEYVYAELVRSGAKALGKVPKGKIAATSVLLIVSGDKTIDDVPEAYRDKVIELLAAQGLDGNGEPAE